MKRNFKIENNKFNVSEVLRKKQDCEDRNVMGHYILKLWIWVHKSTGAHYSLIQFQHIFHAVYTESELFYYETVQYTTLFWLYIIDIYINIYIYDFSCVYKYIFIYTYS